MNNCSFRLPRELSAAVETISNDWASTGKVERLWSGDATLWTSSDESDWLGWLKAPNVAAIDLSSWLEFGREVRDTRISDVLVLGMGGSSLCPEVLSRSFGAQAGHPALHVLDSTEPAQIRTFESRLDLEHTLCIVSSKSGTTLEPWALMQYFLERIGQAIRPQVGSKFIAITDPGSRLEATAEELSFRWIFRGTPSIGGRFSALSPFGMVPGAAMGLDVATLLASARSMAGACSAETETAENPGVQLGAVLGAAALAGRNKLTIVTSNSLRSLGAWLEQLIAESTGKDGKAIIPVDAEFPLDAGRYGGDRIFVEIGLEEEDRPLSPATLENLISAGHPVISIKLDDRYALGGEFFRWEFATAVAGAVMGVNPFDQPDVEASKIATQSLTSAYESTGSLADESPVATAGHLQLFGDAETIASLRSGGSGDDADFDELLRRHLEKIEPDDYFALLAFLEMRSDYEHILQEIRRAVLERYAVATCLGFGPRFLHSTGQAYKGGPNTGVFLQITADHSEDISVPESGYSFGIIETAQARGDLEVLVERGRRVLRVHLEGEILQDLQDLLHRIG